jgi:hypothetical protein
VNGAYNSNKIVSMSSENLAGDVVNAIGGPAGQYQLYPYVGVNRDNGNYNSLIETETLLKLQHQTED